jgi:hypothetical protein
LYWWLGNSPKYTFSVIVFFTLMAYGEDVYSVFGRDLKQSDLAGRSMSDENQILIPPSFIALFVPPGRIKPTESREYIAERYDFCEDLATLMVEHAKSTQFDLGITEHDVLERSLAGLQTAEAGVTLAEASWVVRRLAELLDWPYSAPTSPQNNGE